MCGYFNCYSFLYFVLQIYKIVASGKLLWAKIGGFMSKNKTLNYDKLKDYGFTKYGEKYVYSCPIVDGQFKLNVYIDETEKISTELYDILSEELYTLHLVKDAGGSFIGRVREEYEKTLSSIEENCFDKEEAFKESLTHKILDYVYEKYGTKPEYLWEKYPQCAVLRRADNQKWYGILMVISKTKLGLKDPEPVEIIDLRFEPKLLPSKIDGKRYFAGYHMNKKHWITIILDDPEAINEIFDTIDKSYCLAKTTTSKRKAKV